MIEGRVFNAATGNALVNARVTLDGTNREAITDESGSYRFSDVPAGAAGLRVGYLGMESATATVSVPAGGSVAREFELKYAPAGRPDMPITLDAFTVNVDREMSAQALSMNEQRQSASIKNVVAMDEYGDRKGSVGQFMEFLPGVSVEFAGSNPHTLSLRGFPGQFTGITMDGAAMTSTFADTSRVQRLEEVSSVNVSRVEVTKVPTPDMPATGLGGSVNLISRSGFETKRRKVAFDFYTSFHSWEGLTFDGGAPGDSRMTSPGHIQPSGEVTLIQPLNDRLALTVGIARHWEHKPMESGTQETDETGEWNLVNLFQRQSQWNSLHQVRSNQSAQVQIDWRAGPNDTFTFGYRFRESALVTNRSVLTFNYGAGATGGPTFTQGAATGVGTVTMNGSGENVYIPTENRLYTLKYRHRSGAWRLDGAFSYAGSATDRLDIDKGFFNTTPAQISNVVIRGEDIPSSGGIIPTKYSATTRTATPVDLLDGGNYAIGQGVSNQADWNMHRTTARIDLARDFSFRNPVTVKTGLALDSSERDNRRHQSTWAFRPNGATDVTSRLASNFDVFDDAFNAEGPTLYGRHVRWFSGRKLYELFRQRPDWFVLNEPLAHQNFVNSSREMSEAVSAAYVRLDLRLLKNRLWIATGVRFERTDTEGRGALNDPNALYRRDASGNFVLSGGQRVLITADPLEQAKLRFRERGAHARQHYSGFYTSLNATFEISDKLLLRGAYAQTLGRPGLNFIIPGTTVSEPTVVNPTITVSNTGLEPWTADSFDLSLESYQIKDGVGSVGVFHKSIRNFFGRIREPATAELLAQYGIADDPIYQNYELVTNINVGAATVRGVEFSYRQSLTFLPEWARGMQAFVNATRLEVEGDNRADFDGFNPETYAAGLSLVRPRYFVKFTASYQGDKRLGAVAANVANGLPADTFRYQAARTRLSVSAQYSFTKRYSVYFSLLDLGGYVQDQQRYAPGTPDYAKNQRRQELGYYTTLGVRGSF